MRAIKQLRDLREVAEPIAGSIYFAREALDNYKQFDLNFLEGYFVSRSAALGVLSGETLAAIFAVFNPAIVISFTKSGWKKVTRDQILSARINGARDSLARILGDLDEQVIRKLEDLLKDTYLSLDEAGHPVYAGLKSLEYPRDIHERLFRICDLIREHRGDSHNVAWNSKGLNGVEITLLSEGYWNIATKSYVFTRGWAPEQVESASESLKTKGFIDKEGKITNSGIEFREEIEMLTDSIEEPIYLALGDKISEAISILEPISKKMLDSSAYPKTASDLGKIISSATS